MPIQIRQSSDGSYQFYSPRERRNIRTSGNLQTELEYHFSDRILGDGSFDYQIRSPGSPASNENATYRYRPPLENRRPGSATPVRLNSIAKKVSSSNPDIENILNDLRNMGLPSVSAINQAVSSASELTNSLPLPGDLGNQVNDAFNRLNATAGTITNITDTAQGLFNIANINPLGGITGTNGKPVFSSLNQALKNNFLSQPPNIESALKAVDLQKPLELLKKGAAFVNPYASSLTQMGNNIKGLRNLYEPLLGQIPVPAIQNAVNSLNGYVDTTGNIVGGLGEIGSLFTDHTNRLSNLVGIPEIPAFDTNMNFPQLEQMVSNPQSLLSNSPITAPTGGDVLAASEGVAALNTQDAASFAGDYDALDPSNSTSSQSDYCSLECMMGSITTRSAEPAINDFNSASDLVLQETEQIELEQQLEIVRLQEQEAREILALSQANPGIIGYERTQLENELESLRLRREFIEDELNSPSSTISERAERGASMVSSASNNATMVMSSTMQSEITCYINAVLQLQLANVLNTTECSGELLVSVGSSGLQNAFAGTPPASSIQSGRPIPPGGEDTIDENIPVDGEFNDRITAISENKLGDIYSGRSDYPCNFAVRDVMVPQMEAENARAIAEGRQPPYSQAEINAFSNRAVNQETALQSAGTPRSQGLDNVIDNLREGQVLYFSRPGSQVSHTSWVARDPSGTLRVYSGSLGKRIEVKDGTAEDYLQRTAGYWDQNSITSYDFNR